MPKCARCGEDGAGLRYRAWWWCAKCWIAVRDSTEQYAKICGADVSGVISTGIAPPREVGPRMVSSAPDSLYPFGFRPASEEKAGR